MADITLSFVLACIVVELTPGPNMAYLALLSSLHGRKAGLSLVAGISAGLLTIGLVVAVGGALLIADHPAVYHGLRWTGVAYMVWLAWDNWRDPRGTDGSADGFDIRYFRHGFITNALNPKAALFYVAVFPSFFDTARPLLTQSIHMTLVSVGIATAVHGLIATLSGGLRPFLDDRQKTRRARQIFSLLLLATAAWFAVSTHRQ